MNYNHLDTSETQIPHSDTERQPKAKLITETKKRIKPDEARFPFCIVWTPLPIITWLIPCIGHTGIGMADGVIHDFSGPYMVTVDDLAFGETHKYSILFM